jgi:carboxypeptidase family protein/TonB-dependent receptor-like protein
MTFNRIARLALFVGLLPAAAGAQTGSSSISGIVRDATGGALPGASVKVINEETAVLLETVTNEEGAYRVVALLPGTYRVETSLYGFEPTVRRPIVLEVGQALAVDVVLALAGQSETITVSGDAPPLVESLTSTVSQVVTRDMLDALPLPNRAASSLASLAPGVIMIDTGVGTAENYPIFSVAGGRTRNQNFILDGGNATNAVGLTRPQQLTTLPVDAMQEFKVITNNYAAEYGHSTGGVVTMSTRSGGSQFHGSLFESLQNDALNARNFFATTKPRVRLNQFGGTFGGPVVRGGTFFFGSWERTRQLTSEPIVSTVPTLLNRTGDFSDLRGSGAQPIAIYDPQTGQPFPGNVIPPDHIDPVARAALKYFPLPNREGTLSNANNYVGTSGSSLDRDIVLGRADHRLRADDSTSTFRASRWGAPTSARSRARARREPSNWARD